MNLLSIGGSDPSSGAGIQSDVKTFASLNAYGLTAITALTGQNSSKFGIVQPSSKLILKNQLNSIFSDFIIDGIKIGMVYNSEIIKIIYDELKNFSIPIVVDPVIKSTTGGMLIKKSALKDFKKYILPLATVVTPNNFEAEILSGNKIDSQKSLLKAGKTIQKLGAKNVIITGLDLKKKYISDFVLTEKQFLLEKRKVSMITHGSGCNYSASMIYAMALGKSIVESAKFAQKFTIDSIKNAQYFGKGVAITQRNIDQIESDLSNAILKFTKIKNISSQIPECQTNFVFSKKNPKSIKDILGISGRIVKTGNNVTKTGNLEYGGSKHVAKATLTMNKKFSQVRAGINLKFQKETISKLEKKGFVVKNYDRTKEPKSIKKKEGASIEWGVNLATQNCKVPPDAIFHKGDYGKEPMIIIFGPSPNSVIEKISKVFT